MKYSSVIFFGGLILALVACSSDGAGDTPYIVTDDIEFAQGDSWEATQALPEARTQFDPIALAMRSV